MTNPKNNNRQMLRTFAINTIWLLCFLIIFLPIKAQVSTGGNGTTSDHQKQIIGYITNWDAWKSTNHGVPGAGALTHMNIDYSKYTILNFSFFGVANDGSLHSGDYRNKLIYQDGQVQEPAPLLHGGVYDSWDMHLIFGELEYKWDFTDAAVQAAGFVVDGAGWKNTITGLTGSMPIPFPKEGGAKGLIDMAHEHGVKVVASIGGWSMCKHYPEMAADATKRANFIADCKRLMVLGFDGIDLDWEYPGPFAGMNFTGSQADYNNFTTLIQEIRNAIGPDKLITAAFSAAPNKLQGFNWSALSNLMDYFNMMTYDFNGGWSAIAGHNAPLYDYPGAEASNWSWNATYEALISYGVPPSKINMGAPFYGRGVITNGTASLNAATVKTQRTVDPDGPVSTAADYSNWGAFDGTPNYEYIRQNKSSWTEHWDDNAKVPYLTKDNYFLSYDNEQSIGLKAQYVVDKGLAGVIVWTVFGDLEISGTATSFGPKLVRYSSVKSPLVNKINEVFAEGNTGMPTVSITSPTNGSTVITGSSVVISATASDAGGSISKVTFSLDGTVLSEDLTSPYSFTISSITEGSHNVTAVAMDNSGNTATASVSFTASDNSSPVVTVTSPANGETFTANSDITITADASDNGSVSKVEFYQNSTKLGEDATSPYSFTWTSVQAGTYAITVIATDNEGATATSEAVNITVNSSGGNCPDVPEWTATDIYTNGMQVQYNGILYEAKWWTQNENPETHSGENDVWKNVGVCEDTNVAPQVAITSPENNQSLVAGSSISISADATDQDGSVASVVFYVNGTILGEDTSAPYSVTWNSIAQGSYTLTAKATDNDGASATSSAITVTVSGTDNIAPEISLTSPSNGSSFTSPASIQITANASDSDGTIAKVEFYYNSILLGEDTSAPYSFDWNSVSAGSYAITVKATDNDGAITTSEEISIIVTGANPDFRIVGYMPSWSGTASEIQYDKLTHIIYAFIRPTTTGGLTSVDNAQKLSDIVALAHANGVKVSIAVGGWSDLNNTDFQTMAGNATYRSNFISSISTLIDTYQLDGVDIDWEYPIDGNDPANFATLMAELSNAMHNKGKILTAAVPALGYYAGGVQNSVFDAVDFLNLMAYDGGSAAEHSPYSYAVSCLDYWLGRGLSTDKAVLGVPFYSRPSQKTFKALVAEGADPYADYYNGDYYNGINTIKDKTNLALDRGIGGIMMWELSQDATGNYSLLSAIYETVGGGSSTNPLPSVSITSPSNGSVFTSPASITISASASDNGSIAKVEFYNGTTKLGEDTSSPYAYTWNSITEGTYTLTAIATDNEGAASTSSAITITVTGSTGGDCDGVAQYVEAGGYVAGSQVQNEGDIYECREWPYSGWCDGAAWAYAPGTGTYWQDAWIFVASCSSQSARMMNEIFAENEEEALILYPNPADNELKISYTGETKDWQVNIYNLVGKRVLQAHTFSNSVDISSLRSGFYKIELISNDKHISDSFIKK